MKKRGVSGGVVITIIALISLVLIAILWLVIFPMFSGSSHGSINLEIVTKNNFTVYDPDTKLASVEIGRGSDSENLEGFDVVFSISGRPVNYKIGKDRVLSPGTTKVYKFDLAEYPEPDSVDIYPILGSSSLTGNVIGFVGNVVGYRSGITGNVPLGVGTVSSSSDVISLDSSAVCEFRNAYWSRDGASKRSSVDLVLKTNGLCDGLFVEFIIYKDNLLFNRRVDEINRVAVILDNSSEVKWTVPSDVKINDDYIFKVLVLEDSETGAGSISIDSTNSLVILPGSDFVSSIREFAYLDPLYTNRNWSIKVVDMNGDGKDDVVATESYRAGLGLSNGNSFIFNKNKFVIFAGVSYANRTIISGNFDGDGRGSVVSVNGFAGWVERVSYNATNGGLNHASFVGNGMVGAAVESISNILVGDFEGDGKEEMAEVTSYPAGYFPPRTAQEIAWGRPDRTNGSTAILVEPLNYISDDLNLVSFVDPLDWSSSMWVESVAADVNGDGMEDLVGRDTFGNMPLGLSNHTAFIKYLFTNTQQGSYFEGNWGSMRAGDFNGDGKDDIFSVKDNTSLYVAISKVSARTGQNFNLTYMGESSVILRSITVVDINSDGKDDIIGFSDNGDLYAEVSDGFSFKEEFIMSKNVDVRIKQFGVGDVDGDNLSEIVALTSLRHIYVIDINPAASILDFSNVCDNNGICNSSLGENETSCPGDCTPCGSSDFNGDGNVDIQDFGILKSNLNTNVTRLTNGDASGDGYVDMADFNILRVNFGDNCSADTVITSASCERNSDCLMSPTPIQDYCNGTRLCVFRGFNATCNNPGTGSAYCSYPRNADVCSVCARGCNSETRTCVVPQTCNITGALWNVSSAVVGQKVKLMITAVNCTGKTFRYVITQLQGDADYSNYANLTSSATSVDWVAGNSSAGVLHPGRCSFDVFASDGSSNVKYSSEWLNVTQSTATDIACYTFPDCHMFVPTDVVVSPICNGTQSCSSYGSKGICNNPGTIASSCALIPDPRNCTPCTNGCNATSKLCNGAIIGSRCSVNSDCGIDSISYRCLSSTSSASNVTNYTCINPGLTSSYCLSSSSGGGGGCLNGCNSSSGRCNSAVVNPCVITNLSWSNASVVGDSNIDLLLTGINCTGKKMNVTIWASDSDVIYALPTDLSFSNVISWPSMYDSRYSSSPGYFFKVLIDGTTYSSKNFGGVLLKVSNGTRVYLTRTIALKEGKNAFSLPLILNDMSVSSVLSSISDKVDRAYTYNQGFKIYNSNGRPSNLLFMEPARGYVLFMKQAANLTIIGSTTFSDGSRPRMNLSVGWNLIGPFSEAIVASSLLSGANSGGGLYTYNENSKKFELVTNPQMILNNRESYWININQATTIPITGDIIYG